MSKEHSISPVNQDDIGCFWSWSAKGIKKLLKVCRVRYKKHSL